MPDTKKFPQPATAPDGLANALPDVPVCDPDCHGEPDIVARLRSDLPDDEVLYDLSELFRVFGDTTRIKILYALFESELCVGDLAQLLDVSQSAVSHQLRLLKASELVKFRRDNVGFIFQSFHLLGTMNAVENVALPLSFRGVPKDVRLKKADKMLDLVNLGKHKKHMPNQMSGGQQQRVGVARALVVDPKIIFADEPTGNLDSHTSEEVMKLMQQVVRQQKKTLVMVTHDNHLATYADRVFHISDGKIIKIENHRSGTEHTEDRDKAISGNMNPQDTEYLKRSKEWE